MSRAIIAVAALATLLLAGCSWRENATRADAGARDCFSASSVRSFTALNETTVRLQVGMHDNYELTLFGFCPEVDWTHSIGLRTSAGSSWICTHDAMSVEVVVLKRSTNIGPDRCRVRSIRKLDPAEMEAENARK